MDKLGKDDFAFVTKKYVIRSAVAAHKIARYDYTDSLAMDRIKNALEIGEGKPFEPSWEGIFNIAVCDVSKMIYHDWPKDLKSKILVPYGKSPKWCGPICEDDNVETRKFFEVTHMEGLKGPFIGCNHDLSGKLVVSGTMAADTALSMNMTLS